MENQDELVLEDLTIEELNDVAAANTVGTASTLSTPVSSAASIGCAG